MKTLCVSCEKGTKFLNVLTESHDLKAIPIFTREDRLNNEKSLNAADDWTKIRVEVPSDGYKSDGLLLH
jgi:hypothetical protein